MSYSQFDVVTLAVDLLDENLRRGMKGVVIDVYHQPAEADERSAAAGRETGVNSDWPD